MSTVIFEHELLFFTKLVTQKFYFYLCYNFVFTVCVCSGWSAPSAIGIAGLGGGFEIGVEVRDTISKLVLFI